MFHRFSVDIGEVELPRQFTYPFHYTPHPLCVMAADEVRRYLATRDDWRAEIDGGKMMGVLVAKDKSGEVGFLAAFSGNLAGSNCHEYFVPPVYDLLNPDGHFHAEESQISAINERINSISTADDYILKQRELRELKLSAGNAIEAHKKLMAESKAKRDAERCNPDADLDAMIRESQWQKAELRRIKAYWDAKITDAENAVAVVENEIKTLKETRHRRSAELQRWLFSQFVMLNANGEKRDLCEIFAETPQQLPPAGAGECAAPKLLQYAYKNGYKPVAMAEFWCGESPKGEVRHDGHFYPACRGKCLPILTFMLQGLDVEPNPLEKADVEAEIEILFEDAYIVAVNKPSGMLTVPGKIGAESLLDHLKGRFADVDRLMAVHRLDMDTSGVVLFAKDKDTYTKLQRQFALRQVHKRYIALLQGVVEFKEGVIDLPLCLNVNHRPQQMVDFENGKCAKTEYRVIESKGTLTKVEFFPLTGRTHQLRVHSAHKLGLIAPILGDPIYGKSEVVDRMYLHAECVEFIHPMTGEKMMIEACSKQGKLWW